MKKSGDIYPHSSVGKESACSAGDPLSSLGREDTLEKEMATCSSVHACKQQLSFNFKKRSTSTPLTPMGSKVFPVCIALWLCSLHQALLKNPVFSVPNFWLCPSLPQTTPIYKSLTGGDLCGSIIRKTCFCSKCLSQHTDPKH